MRFAWLGFVAGIGFTACKGASDTDVQLVDPPIEADTDVDTDTDSDADTDVDTDADADADPVGGDPCAPTLPSDTVVVDENLVITEPGSYLACRNNQVSIATSGALVYAYRGVDIVVNGTGNFMMVDAQADVVLLDGPNEVWVESTSSVDDQATPPNNTINVCPNGIALDVSLVPGGGC